MLKGIHPVILGCIGFCLLLLVGVMGRQTILNMVKRIVIGICCIIAINLLLPETFRVGVNLLTMGCTSLLGMPGVVMLYLIGFILI